MNMLHCIHSGRKISMYIIVQYVHVILIEQFYNPTVCT